MKKSFLFLGIAMLFSCKNMTTDNIQLSKDEMLSIVKDYDDQFRRGVQQRDSAIITDFYSESAQYIIPQKSILVGKKQIGKEWGEFLRLKEKPIDLILNTNDVSGNRDVIYETGQGYTLLADSTKWTFNYVNVWRRQKDGSYKLDIDMYN